MSKNPQATLAAAADPKPENATADAVQAEAKAAPVVAQRALPKPAATEAATPEPTAGGCFVRQADGTVAREGKAPENELFRREQNVPVDPNQA